MQLSSEELILPSDLQNNRVQAPWVVVVSVHLCTTYLLKVPVYHNIIGQKYIYVTIYGAMSRDIQARCSLPSTSYNGQDAPFKDFNVKFESSQLCKRSNFNLRECFAALCGDEKHEGGP